jgi:NADPH:quinone reductase-like Zn-dependent oxidoreductase
MNDDNLKHFPKDVKCVILQGYGNIKQLRSITIPLKKPGDNEVLVNVKSCGINFLDLQTQQGIINDLPKLPFVPGYECSGKIVYLGSNTTGFDIGDRVICLPKLFAFSEYLVINVRNIYKIPDYVSYDDAAALAYSYLTAYILLFEIGCLKQSQSILFHSAGGGVGFALIQLCRTIDNVNVFATSSKSKHDILKAIYDNLYDENDYLNEIKK